MSNKVLFILVTIFFFGSCTRNECEKNAVIADFLQTSQYRNEILKGDTLHNLLVYLARSLNSEVSEIQASLRLPNAPLYLSEWGNKVSFTKGMTIYRYLDEIGEFKPHQLIPFLMDLKSSTDDSCLKIIATIELTYLAGKENEYGLDNVNSALKELSQFQKRYPSSLRIARLEAELLVFAGEYTNAITYFKELIEKKYHEFRSLKSIISAYAKLDSIDSVQKYIVIANERFNNGCILEELKLIGDSSTLERKCRNCLESMYFNDPIVARIELCKLYLRGRNFKLVDTNCRKYLAGNDVLATDGIKLWERGEYYDLILRSYFLQAKYDELVSFLVKSIGYNEKIKVENSADLEKLIRAYYQEYYTNPSDENFNNFYRRNFRAFESKILKGGNS